MQRKLKSLLKRGKSIQVEQFISLESRKFGICGVNNSSVYKKFYSLLNFGLLRQFFLEKNGNNYTHSHMPRECLVLLREPAFTLAEVLITLVVIGVIAAITVPAVIQKTNEKEYAAANQKARASIGEAFRLMSVNDETDKTVSTANYTKNVLSRYLKIIKTCDNAKDCDFPEKIKRPDGEVVSPIPTTMSTITSPYGVKEPASGNQVYSSYSTANDTTTNYNNAYFFITLDGFHVMFFYNPYCVFNSLEKPYYWTSNTANSEIQRQVALDVACYWGVYDMNGIKKPNQVGKDIGFVGSFYNGANTKAVSVLPAPLEEKQTSSISGGSDHWQRASEYCNNLDNGKYRLPDVNELSLMYLNRKFVTDINNTSFWSSMPLPGFAYMRRVDYTDGARTWSDRSYSGAYVRCVRTKT